MQVGDGGDFQAGRGLAGLDQHQVRTWTSWHQWVTLAMLACALIRWLRVRCELDRMAKKSGVTQQMTLKLY